MLNLINGAFNTNVEAIAKIETKVLKENVRKFWRSLKDSTSTSNTAAEVYSVNANELITRLELEIKRLDERVHRRERIEVNREYYKVLRDPCNIDMSAGQHTIFGKVNNVLLGSNLLNEILHGGCPSDGGSHTLYLRDNIENTELWLDIVESELADGTYLSQEDVSDWVKSAKEKITKIKGK